MTPGFRKAPEGSREPQRLPARLQHGLRGNLASPNLRMRGAFQTQFTACLWFSDADCV